MIETRQSGDEGKNDISSKILKRQTGEEIEASWPNPKLGAGPSPFLRQRFGAVLVFHSNRQRPNTMKVESIPS